VHPERRDPEVMTNRPKRAATIVHLLDLLQVRDLVSIHEACSFAVAVNFLRRRSYPPAATRPVAPGDLLLAPACDLVPAPTCRGSATCSARKGGDRLMLGFGTRIVAGAALWGLAAALAGGELSAVDNVFLSVTAVLVLALADRREAITGWDALARDAEKHGSLLSHISISLWRGHTLCRHGELREAEATLRQLHGSLASFSAQTEGRVHAAAFLSNVLRERGDLAGARRALHAVHAPGGSSDAARLWLDSLTELLIAEERFAQALTATKDAERRFAFLANPIDTPTHSHLAVALGAHHRVGARRAPAAMPKPFAGVLDGAARAPSVR
ncbi:MAG: hypothetical protein ACRDL5_16035, partial [Solirubrobacteraceae bacterium]